MNGDHTRPVLTSSVMRGMIRAFDHYAASPECFSAADAEDLKAARAWVRLMHDYRKALKRA